MKNKKIYLGLASLLLVLTFYYSISPYITLWKLRNAIETNNIEAISAHVDYRSLKESLKLTYKIIFSDQIKQSEKILFGDYQKTQIANMIEKMSTDLSTPEGVRYLMIGEFPTAEQMLLNEKPVKEKDYSISDSYISINKYIVDILDKKTNTASRLTFKRVGLFSWVLISQHFIEGYIP